MSKAEFSAIGGDVLQRRWEVPINEPGTNAPVAF